MKRKLFSVLLTAALLLSATVPAFADDDESVSSANDTSSDAEFSASASEEGPVEDENTFDAPSVVEGFTADDVADTDETASDFDTDTPDDADELAVLDGEFEQEEPAEETITGESAIDEEAVAEEVPETSEEPVAEDVPEIVEEPVAEDAPETVEEPVAEDVPETVEEPVAEDVPETVEEPVAEDVPETVEEPVTEDVPKAVEEPVTEDVPETVEEPVAEDVPETVKESLTDTLDAAPKMMTAPAMAVNAAPVLPDEVAEDKENDEELFATLFGEIPVISVEVPDSGHILINPYRLKVQHGSDTVQDEIISDTSVLVNRSNVALSVQASAIGWAEDSSSAVRFVDDVNDMQNKDLFVYYEFQNASDQSGDVRWSGSYSGASNQLVVRNGANAASELSEVLTIPAADDDSPTYVALRAFGSASVPSAGSWKKTDTVNIRVAFTFIPV